MLGYEKYHQLSFTLTMGVGVKRFTVAFKISINHPQALIGLASGLSWASSFLSRSSIIFKRLWFYTLANNCFKPVRKIHLTASTYTFNYYYLMYSNVIGEIRKKTLLTKSTCLNNISAPKIRNFSTSIPQTGALVLV